MRKSRQERDRAKRAGAAQAGSKTANAQALAVGNQLGLPCPQRRHWPETHVSWGKDNAVSSSPAGSVPDPEALGTSQTSGARPLGSGPSAGPPAPSPEGEVGNNSSCSQKRKTEEEPRNSKRGAGSNQITPDPKKTILVFAPDGFDLDSLEIFSMFFWSALQRRGDEFPNVDADARLHHGRIRMVVHNTDHIAPIKTIIASLTPPGGKKGEWKAFGPDDELPFTTFIVHLKRLGMLEHDLNFFGEHLRYRYSDLRGGYLEAVDAFPRGDGRGFIVRVRVGNDVLPVLEAMNFTARYGFGGEVHFIVDRGERQPLAHAGRDNDGQSSA